VLPPALLAALLAASPARVGVIGASMATATPTKSNIKLRLFLKSDSLPRGR
jgi:hypothetical protein